MEGCQATGILPKDCERLKGRLQMPGFRGSSSSGGEGYWLDRSHDAKLLPDETQKSDGLKNMLEDYGSTVCERVKYVHRYRNAEMLMKDSRKSDGLDQMPGNHVWEEGY
jgi:hypothetical protein